jgi:predicted O-methyltransferase YrrM
LENDKLNAYIENLIPERPDFFMKMEEYASENGVPIMEVAGMEAMLQILRIGQPTRILEIGAAIGYSALRMAHALPNVTIVTIERDEERANVAVENFARFESEFQKKADIHLIVGDALEVENEVSKLGPYDVIFIDAAKGQYKRFFELYSKYGSDNGMIVTDNVLFKGLVAEEHIEKKRTSNLVKKINTFNEWLLRHPEYYTAILPVGDGVAISKRRGGNG